MFDFGPIVREEAAIERQRVMLCRAIDVAHSAGSTSVYGTTGGRGALSWEEGAASFVEAIRPCLEYAQQQGVRLLIEPTNALTADAHLVHTLRDTVDLAERAGMDVCLDVFPVWTEPDLEAQIRRMGSKLALVQISDFVYGDRSLPSRAVPGDGAIPLRRIIETVLESGYDGRFDLEVLGPRIDAEGHRTAMARSAERLGEILNELGA
jgi:sugar phosphate isomerase/epimerase